MPYNPPKVLVVDDDPGTRRMVKTYLELEGYEAAEAADGADALLLVESNPPQAILLDVMMPGMDGYAVCRRLRENSKTSRAVIIFISALDKTNSKIQGLQVGADDFVTKPFDPPELIARLKAHFRRLSAQKEKEEMLENLAEKLAVMNRRLQEEAATDSLTRLYNRRYFCKRLEDELRRAKRYGHPLSFMMIDLDRFKSINDDLGHPFGDRVLLEFADMLRAQVRGIDLVCRWGGEEFGVLLLETPLPGARLVAERIQEAGASISIPPLAQGQPTFSAGLASFPEHGASTKDLYESADRALYEAKAKGRNLIVTAGV